VALRHPVCPGSDRCRLGAGRPSRPITALPVPPRQHRLTPPAHPQFGVGPREAGAAWGAWQGRGWPVFSSEATSPAAGPRSTGGDLSLNPGGDLSLNPGGHAQATGAGPLYSIFDPLRSDYLVYFGAATQCVQLTEARSPPYLPTRPPRHQPSR
jgi:hypothetical protein